MVKVGIIGDFDAAKSSHPATDEAIRHAAAKLSIEPQITWLPTSSLMSRSSRKRLDSFDCLWASSGGPYQSATGMLKGIQLAREMDKPFIAT